MKQGTESTNLTQLQPNTAKHSARGISKLPLLPPKMASPPFQKGVGAGSLAKATGFVLLGTSCSEDLHPRQRVHGTVSGCVAHQSICTGITNCSVRHLAHSRVFTSELSSGKVAFSGENPRGIFLSLCKLGCPRAWSCQAGMAGPAAVQRSLIWATQPCGTTHPPCSFVPLLSAPADSGHRSSLESTNPCLLFSNPLKYGPRNIYSLSVCP